MSHRWTVGAPSSTFVILRRASAARRVVSRNVVVVCLFIFSVVSGAT